MKANESYGFLTLLSAEQQKIIKSKLSENGKGRLLSRVIKMQSAICEYFDHRNNRDLENLISDNQAAKKMEAAHKAANTPDYPYNDLVMRTPYKRVSDLVSDTPFVDPMKKAKPYDPLSADNVAVPVPKTVTVDPMAVKPKKRAAKPKRGSSKKTA